MTEKQSHDNRVFLDSTVLTQVWHWWLENCDPAFDRNLLTYRRLMAGGYDIVPRVIRRAENFESWLAEKGGIVVMGGIVMTSADATFFLLKWPCK